MPYTDIISYCCGSYDTLEVGGVARYDYQLKLIFPNRVFFRGPEKKNKMLRYLSKCKKPLIITDNHLSLDIPNRYDILLVHHGCALTTANRNPDWGEPWKSLCVNGQEKMLKYRDPKTTRIVSISKACTDDFTRYFGKEYTRFERHDILHPSELDESRFVKKFNKKPVILGNWGHVKKGKNILPLLKENLKEFQFEQLKVGLDKRGVDDFNRRKQDIYLSSDIFLQISNSEGNSYATLDAMLCGLVIVASDVGLFYGDVPEDCFVKMDWRRNGDWKYVRKCIENAWENKEKLSRNCREWYLNTCSFKIWKNLMVNIVKMSEYYGVEYFTWQSKVGLAGGHLNKFKFVEDIKKDHVVLDFGCGGGYLLKNLDCKEKYGVEINEKAHEECRKNGVKVFKSIDELEDGKFDRIISNHALEHVHEPLTALKNLHKKLKIGGKITIVVPYEQPHENGFEWKEDDRNQHLYTWCPMTLGNLVKLAGFDLKKAKTVQHMWPDDYQISYKKSNFHQRCIDNAKKNRNYQIKVIGLKV